MDSILAALGIKSLTTSIAGLVGGFLSLRFFDGLNVYGKVSTVLGGWACANYGTPFVIQFYKLVESDGYHAGIAFAIGLFGMSMVAAVFQVIKRADWVELARSTPFGRFFPGGGNDGGKQP